MNETFGESYPYDEPDTTADEIERAHLDALRENAARRIGLAPDANWEDIAQARRDRLQSDQTPDAP